MIRTPVVLEPNAVVAVDVVLFTVREAARVEDMWQVLLVQTDDPAFGYKWALPGVLARSEETFDAAARRALHNKAGLDAHDWYLDQLGTFGDPGRDTRGRVVSVAHVALVRSDHLSLVPGGGASAPSGGPSAACYRSSLRSTTAIYSAPAWTASAASSATRGLLSSSSRKSSPSPSCAISTPAYSTRRSCGCTRATSKRRSPYSSRPALSCPQASAPAGGAALAAPATSIASPAQSRAPGSASYPGTLNLEPQTRC